MHVLKVFLNNKRMLKSKYETQETSPTYSCLAFCMDPRSKYTQARKTDQHGLDHF